MKKNFTLLLALVMIASCFFSIAPAADATAGGGASSESYEPSIAYANVNYSEDLILMFAVPVPAEGALAEGSSVKVVLWTAADRIYRYSDADAKLEENVEDTIFALEAEDAKATIGGVEHLVYKYKGLAAEKMTDTVYARAVVVDKDNKATAYSDVLDYSVVEYVHTAKGAFNNGTPVIANEDVIELLDSILDFGAAVQEIEGDGEPYAPNGYLANDELHKIWVTPVVAGKTMDKVFAGFFKYEEDGYATVHEPFFDGYTASVYKNANGEALQDANPEQYDEALGFQIDAVDSDIEITVEYSHVLHRQINAADYGPDFRMDNTERTVYGNQAKDNGAGFDGDGWATYLRRVKGDSVGNATFALGAEYGTSGQWYHSIRTVEDPDDPDNYVFHIVSSNSAMMSISSQLSSDGKAFYGYGDTLDESITFEMEIGKPNPNANVSITGIFLRDRSAWGGWSEDHAYNGEAPLKKDENGEIIVKDGKTQVDNKYTSNNLFSYVVRVLDNKVILPGNNAEICTLPDTGLVKIAVTIHGNGELKAYYSNEDGEMVCAGTWDAEKAMLMSNAYKAKHAQYLANLTDDNNDNDNDLLPYKDIATFIEMSTLETAMYVGPQGSASKYNSSKMNEKWSEEFKTAKVVMGEDTVSVANDDGTYNPLALRAYMEQNYGFLMRTLSIYIGDVYGTE